MNFFAREMVIPRLNLLCDLYRLTLEILRHNVRLIHIYAKVKKWSYDFCIKYENRNEFHRIFETSQRHLVELINPSPSGKSKVLERPNLTSLDTTLAYMVTRADQLEVACKFRMWSIAFSSAEEICIIIANSKIQPTQKFMIHYYSRLVEIFENTGNSLYHANALVRLTDALSCFDESHLGIASHANEKTKLVSATVLALLTVNKLEKSPMERNVYADLELERSRKIFQILLGNHHCETNYSSYHEDYMNSIKPEKIIKRIIKRHPNFITDDVIYIYELLKKDYICPIRTCKLIYPILAKLSQSSPFIINIHKVVPLCINLAKYVKGLEVASVLRTLKRMQSLYIVMNQNNLTSFVPFLTVDRLEEIIVCATKFDFARLKLDHKTNSILFISYLKFNLEISENLIHLNFKPKMIPEQNEYAFENLSVNIGNISDLLSSYWEDKQTKHVNEKILKCNYTSKNDSRNDQNHSTENRAKIISLNFSNYGEKMESFFHSQVIDLVNISKFMITGKLISKLSPTVVDVFRSFTRAQYKNKFWSQACNDLNKHFWPKSNYYKSMSFVGNYRRKKVCNHRVEKCQHKDKKQRT
jgi:hypothetical protein